ncbi:kinase-like domain-containing protein [Chaetomium sp. MPI-SDFR-AT-0129]|nr:kinase-like domain-containing protein [Chaetomium sp. MPI-SDFR-AT-0129]
MASTFKRSELPYYAPANKLPAPLPTVEEILAATEFTPPNTVHERKIPVLKGCYAVKYGRDITLQEGENMLFIERYTNVPIPAVYAIFHDEKTGFNFIIQEYIRGRLLRSVWGKLASKEKQAIVSQLRRDMDEVRNLPSPGYYGGIWRQQNRNPLFNQIVWREAVIQHPEPNLVKPMATEQEWADTMASCVRASVKNLPDNWNERRLAILRQHYRRVFSGHPPVFSHGDFSPSNIILREDGKGAVIIDWQYAGWYPSCWEFGISMVLHGYGDDWLEWLPRILDEFIPESGWIMSYRDLVFG